MQNFFTWATVKQYLINLLKGQFIKLVLKKVFGFAVVGGFKGWLVKLIATELFEEIGEPVIKFAFRKMGYVYNRVEGEIDLKKIRDAKEENDRAAYRISISDV